MLTHDARNKLVYRTGWSATWGTFADYANVEGVDAGTACCACGKGGDAMKHTPPSPPSSPPSPPSPPSSPPQLFVTGPCVVTMPNCVESSSYQDGDNLARRRLYHSATGGYSGSGGYSDREECEIKDYPAEAIIVDAFDVETGYSCGGSACSCDYLEVTSADGFPVKYCGSNGPDGVVAGGTIKWVSDALTTGGGWRICFGVAPPAPPYPLAPPPSPPSPPLQPGSIYAVSSSDLIAALKDSAVSRIVLVAGIYEFVDSMCSDQETLFGSALCIDRAITIEAEVAGSVVLDAKGARRVIFVSSGGRAELIGLNITGGNAKTVCSRNLLNLHALGAMNSPSFNAMVVLTVATCCVAGGELSRESNPRVTFHDLAYAHCVGGVSWQYKDRKVRVFVPNRTHT